MNPTDIEKITELLTQINEAREQIKLLRTKQTNCKSDPVWWGIEQEIDEQSRRIIKYEDELLPLIKSLCSQQFNIDIEEAKKIRNRANQAIIDLNKYMPNNYKRFISIIAEITDIESEIP